jgi:hypothetical protein
MPTTSPGPMSFSEDQFPHIYSLAQKLKAIEREIGLRRRVYPGLIAKGKMKAASADNHIRIFEAIADDYRQALAKLP